MHNKHSMFVGKSKCRKCIQRKSGMYIYNTKHINTQILESENDEGEKQGI